MDIGTPEITGGGAVGLGTILLWQFVRLIGKVQKYFDTMDDHRKALEDKLDTLIVAVRGVGAPVPVDRQNTPIRDISASGEHRA